MRLMRPNYDKRRRCPGWSGPAMKWAKDDTRTCNSGSIDIYTYYDPNKPWYGEPGYSRWTDLADKWRTNWKFGHCTNADCDVVTLPWVFRLIDPSWHLDNICFKLKYLPSEIKYVWRDFKDAPHWAFHWHIVRRIRRPFQIARYWLTGNYGYKNEKVAA